MTRCPPPTLDVQRRGTSQPPAVAQWPNRQSDQRSSRCRLATTRMKGHPFPVPWSQDTLTGMCCHLKKNIANQTGHRTTATRPSRAGQGDEWADGRPRGSAARNSPNELRRAQSIDERNRHERRAHDLGNQDDNHRHDHRRKSSGKERDRSQRRLFCAKHHKDDHGCSQCRPDSRPSGQPPATTPGRSEVVVIEDPRTARPRPQPPKESARLQRPAR